MAQIVIREPMPMSELARRVRKIIGKTERKYHQKFNLVLIKTTIEREDGRVENLTIQEVREAIKFIVQLDLANEMVHFGQPDQYGDITVLMP